MEGAIVAVTFLLIPLTYLLTKFYLQLQEMKLKHGTGDNSEYRKEMGNLMAENEEMKERLKNIEAILGNEKQRIDLNYEKEQILIDQQNKIK